VANSKKGKKSQVKKFAEIERISIGGMVSRLSPVGLWVYGNSYINAAVALPKPKALYDPVRYYLACHAIELLLKAYLAIQGSSLLDLIDSRFGHNLDSILNEAESHGLNDLVDLPDKHKTEIHKAAYYYSGKVFEYPAMGEAVVAYPHLPNLYLLFEAAQSLVNALDLPCKEA